MPYTFYNGPIGIQSEGAIVLTQFDLTSDCLALAVNAGPLLTGTTLGILRSYITGYSGLVNDGGLLMLDGSQPSWPTDPTGLAAGSCYSNELFVHVTPGGVAAGSPLIFPGVTATQLLRAGAGPLLGNPSPPAGSRQLFIQGGFVCVA